MVLLVRATNPEHGSKALEANKWFCCWDCHLSEGHVMWDPWKPTKREIEMWID